jgi:hypothetical protein
LIPFNERHLQMILRDGSYFCGPQLYVPGTLGYGNVRVGTIDAPANKTTDFALLKEFKIRERHSIQFRWEAFNFLNTPQFSAPTERSAAPPSARSPRP